MGRSGREFRTEEAKGNDRKRRENRHKRDIVIPKQNGNGHDQPIYPAYRKVG